MALLPHEVIESLFKVETKTPVNGQRVVPFVLNPVQRSIDHSTLLHKMHVIPKARQLGVSTYIEARFLAKCMTVEGTHAAVVSHEKQATARLLRRVHFFLNNLDDERARSATLTEYDNKYEITFPKTKSSFYIGTAGQKAFSRGDMLTDFHGSEVAYWPDPEMIMTGVIGALTNDAECFLESTGNGMGGYFYERCLEAQADESKGDLPWKLHFFPWFLAPEYSRPVKEGTIWSPEELWIKERYKLTEEQLAWRRFKKSQYDSEEKFLQEFPSNLDECFIVSGTCYFDKTSLRLYHRTCKDPVAKGSIENIGEEARFFRSEEGRLKIWDWPKPMVEYLITADCSEGIESNDTDNTHIQIINRENLSQAASINGKLDPIITAQRLYALGKFYKWPWIAVEDNGPGLACLLKLKELGYPKIFKHKRFDLETQKELDKLGWHTDQRTRPLILTELRNSVKHQTFGIRDAQFVKEMTTFCKQKDGTYKANSGCHDDTVMANAIAVYLHSQLPYQPEEDYFNDRGNIGPRQVITRGHKTGY